MPAKDSDLSASERMQFENMKKMVPGASLDHVHTMPNGMKIMSTPIKQEWQKITTQVRTLPMQLSMC